MPQTNDTPAAATHTPGPWTVEADPARTGQRWKVTAPTPKPTRRYTVTVVVNHDAADAPTAEADARLIAAAPDLLAALTRLLEERSPFEGDTETCECGPDGDGHDAAEPGWVCEHIQARRAIAKAKAIG